MSISPVPQPGSLFMGVRLDNGDLAVFPRALTEIASTSDPPVEPVDLEAAMREWIARGDVRALICECNEIEAHYHFLAPLAGKFLAAL